MALHLLAAVVVLVLVTGCGTTASTRAPVEAPHQPGLDRDRLLSVVAACHLLRVDQTSDPTITDATVIAATKKYGFSIGDVLTRSDALRQASRSRQREIARSVAYSCNKLARLTGVRPTPVRFKTAGKSKPIWLRVSGEIKDGFAERVVVEIRSQKAVGVIINSPGGSVIEARSLGRYLRSKGLRTAVDKSCLSACVDVLAGGVERYITPGAVLGIHQSKAPRHLSSHESGQAYVAGSALYLREMGVDESIALVAAAVPHNKIFLISTENALEARLATNVISSL